MAYTGVTPAPTSTGCARQVAAQYNLSVEEIQRMQESHQDRFIRCGDRDLTNNNGHLNKQKWWYDWDIYIYIHTYIIYIYTQWDTMGIYIYIYIWMNDASTSPRGVTEKKVPELLRLVNYQDLSRRLVRLYDG